MNDRPWHQRALELEPKEHHWADFAAWSEWFDKYMNKHEELIEPDAFDKASTKIALYCMCCDLLEPPTAPGREEVR